MKKKISINDIAKALGISNTTVSFILNGKAKEKRISESLVQRVLKYVDEINYKPNSLARSLRTGKTNIIGLMVEDISNPFFASIARLIEENAYKNGYKILYCSTENDLEKTTDLIQMFRDRHVDGYIIVPPEGLDSEIVSLKANNKPVVLFDRCLPDVETDFVVINNEESSYHGVKHLIDNGYKDIAIITIDSLQPQMQDRILGYERALEEQGLTAYIKEIAYKDNEHAVRQITTFLQRKPNIDAIFFTTNYLCVSGLKALRELNLSIPNDIAVISFDECELFQMYSPSITVIAQPFEEISVNVINILLAKLGSESKDGDYMQITLPASFIERDSSRVKANKS